VRHLVGRIFSWFAWEESKNIYKSCGRNAKLDGTRRVVYNSICTKSATAGMHHARVETNIGPVDADHGRRPDDGVRVALGNHPVLIPCGWAREREREKNRSLSEPLDVN
jgi:hypothetical protein